MDLPLYPARPSPKRTSWLAWLGGGTLLLVLHVLLLALSPRLASNAPLTSAPILECVGLLSLGGVLYLALPWLIARSPADPGLLVWILAVGVAVRLLMLPSTPILEDDFHRYLWDGAMTANGVNPYLYSPVEALDQGSSSAARAVAEEAPEAVRTLINHPHLRTVYPPTAQFFFALAYWAQAWSLPTWRLLLVGVELVTATLLLLLLRRHGRSPLWIALYWWNPLVVIELINAAHMDAVLIPLLAGSVLLAADSKPRFAAIALGLAAGVKLWPILLLPLILRPLSPNLRLMTQCVLIFLATLGAQATPIWLAGLDLSSGFVAYGQFWEMNDALFMAIAWTVEGLGGLFLDWPFNHALLTRLIVGAIVLALVAGLARRPVADPGDASFRVMLVTAAVFLLSPTQFPWYYAWVLPWLVLHPHYSLLSLTALLPLYYLRFYFQARGAVQYFDYGVVWIEHLPVWLLITYEWIESSRGSRTREGRA